MILLEIPDLASAGAVLRALRREQRIVGCDVCRAHAEALEQAIEEAEKEQAILSLPQKQAGHTWQGSGA